MAREDEVRVEHVRCPYCHEHVRPQDVKVGCEGCMAWHHRDCLAEHGRCAACEVRVAQGEPGKRAPSSGDVRARLFASNWSSWDALLESAADLATACGRERVLAISHSQRASEGVVVVWHRGPAGKRRLDPRPQEALRFRSFESMWDSWQVLLDRAAGFASLLDPEQLLGICHSAESSTGLVVVWYWD